jgi:hypothetical protein
MTDLIACLSVGKGTWVEVTNLINSGNFKNIYLVTSSAMKERFSSQIPVNFILINPMQDISEIKTKIHSELHGKIKDLEVALNLNSGIGKEHMAIIQAILELGIAFRQVIWKNNHMQEI